jgi:hypothetical protein
MGLAKRRVTVYPTPRANDTELVTVTMPRGYWKMLLFFLSDLSFRFSCDGCNDLYIPGCSPYKELDREAYKEYYEEQNQSKGQLALQLEEEKEYIGTGNGGILGYLNSFILKATGVDKEDVDYG